MGKNSLLESTSKKKPKGKTAKGKAAKKVATRKGKAQKAVTQAKLKPKGSPAKKVAAKAAKAPAKVKKAPAHKKAPVKQKPAKKLTVKELLFKKFDVQPPKALYSPPAKAGSADVASPSYFAGMSEAATTTAKEALKRKFDWEEIKAAGQKYATEMAAKTEAEAKRKAEEEARRKAEAEAQRKAEEEARRKAEAEAQRKAEEEARRKAEADAQRKAEEEARRKAEAEAQRKAEGEAQRKAEAEAAAVPPNDDSAASLDGGKPFKLGLIALGAVLLLLIMSSYSNTKKYYIAEENGTIAIRRGTFTPMGTTLLITMTDVQMPATPQDVYGWQEAYHLIYQHYINAADKLLEAPGIPDTAALSAQLEQAVKHAPNRELRDAARSRLVGIRAQIYVHKAQAALNRGTIDSAKAALDYLKEATYLDLSAAEEELIKRHTADAEKALADLETAKREAERLAAEEAALEAEAQKLKEISKNSSAVEAETH